jgi:fatty acid synthase
MYRNLHDAKDMTTDATRYPKGYAGLPPRQGLLPDELLSQFDGDFFRMNQKQVDKSDIIMRMLLEVTHEALLDAGLDVAALRGSRTGVYVGHCFSDWLSTSRTDPKLTGYEIVNGAHSMIANRLSFFFDFKGPSLVIDTACSSSATALHSANRDLAAGLIDRAVVAGASLTLDPQTNRLFHSFNMLSPTGRCHSFDTRADGYCRSEALVAVVLEASHAPMGYGRLAAVSINSDGAKSEGITYPSRVSQAKNALEAFARSGVSPRDIGYVEAHGTGTVAGDREELAGLQSVFYPSAPRNAELSRVGTELDVARTPTEHDVTSALPDVTDGSGRERSRTPSDGAPRHIPIGSIKSNLGHTEGASGLVSLVKILMMYEGKTLLPNLHYEKTEHHELKTGFFEVPTAPTPWTPKPACVSNYGFGGSNAFFIMVPTPDAAFADAPACATATPFTFGNTPTAPPLDPEWAARQIAANNHLLYAYRNGEPCTARDKVAYVFGGQGAQWHKMGQSLLESSPTFRATIERCDAHLKAYGVTEVSLLDLYVPDRSKRSHRPSPGTVAAWRRCSVRVSAHLCSLRALVCAAATPTALSGMTRATRPSA